MLHFFFAAVWGIAILMAAMGWGQLLYLALFRHHSDWPQSAIYGIVAMVTIGGILNAFHIVFAVLLMGIVLMGAGIAAIIILYRWHELSRFLREGSSHWCTASVLIPVILILSIMLLRFGGSAVNVKFNEHDDSHAYLVFPLKMLQVGSFDADPFSERRIVTSLGGSTFLQAMTVSPLDIRSINLIDGGLAPFLLLIVTAALLAGLHIPRQYILSTALIIALMPPLAANTTSVLLPAAMFVALARLMLIPMQSRSDALRRDLLLAMTAAALCTLKSSFIPAVVLFIGFFYVLPPWREWRARLASAVICAVLFFAFLAPWMLESYRTCGTALYPILGKGFHISAYGLTPSLSAGMPLGRILRILAVSAVFLIAALVMFHWRRRADVGRVAVALLAATGITSGMLGFATGGFGFLRYPFPFILAGILLVLATFFHAASSTGPGKFLPPDKVFAFLLSIITLLIGLAMGMQSQYRSWIQGWSDAIHNTPLTNTAEQTRLLAAERTVPSDQLLLERVSHPFLLDFQRQRVLIDDYPGSASLPPGMPLFEGSEPLARYLLAHSVRYIIYDYRDQADFARDNPDLRERLSPTYPFPWLRQEARNTFDFQDNLTELAVTRAKLYDDGQTYVLDLATPALPTKQ